MGGGEVLDDDTLYLDMLDLINPSWIGGKINHEAARSCALYTPCLICPCMVLLVKPEWPCL